MYRHETVTFRSNSFLMNIQNILYIQSLYTENEANQHIMHMQTIYSTDSLYQNKINTFWNLNIKARTKNDLCFIMMRKYYCHSVMIKFVWHHYVNHTSKNPGIHKRMIDKSKSILWKCLAFNYICIWNPNIFSLKHYLR